MHKISVGRDDDALFGAGDFQRLFVFLLSQPQSRTWTASCPAASNSAATSGETALSTRNFIGSTANPCGQPSATSFNKLENPPWAQGVAGLPRRSFSGGGFESSRPDHFLHVGS
jgi:hypothetical protein